MTLKEFLASEYAQELTTILGKIEPLGTPQQVRNTLKVNYKQLEYNGYFRRNSRQDLLNNTCKEMWSFVDACNPEIPIKK
tara:strand:+ start:11 stop:250 length:240 start_codon:yes stop_codon:yes gene_type:complete